MRLFNDSRHSEKGNFFSFFLKIFLTKFKSISAEFKYCRDSNGLKILFHTLTMTDARIHFEGMFFISQDMFQFY